MICGTRLMKTKKPLRNVKEDKYNPHFAIIFLQRTVFEVFIEKALIQVILIRIQLIQKIKIKIQKIKMKITVAFMTIFESFNRGILI